MDQPGADTLSRKAKLVALKTKELVVTSQLKAKLLDNRGRDWRSTLLQKASWS